MLYWREAKLAFHSHSTILEEGTFLFWIQRAMHTESTIDSAIATEPLGIPVKMVSTDEVAGVVLVGEKGMDRNILTTMLVPISM